MATTFRFIVEDKSTQSVGKEFITDVDGNVAPKVGASKRPPILTGSNRGVEHNRYMRAFNPVLNRVTGGWWEKGNRLGRAGIGVTETWSSKGAGAALTSVGAILIAQFIIMEAFKLWEKEKKKANEENEANYLKLKSGATMLSKEYKITKNIFGKHTYANQ